MSQPTREFYRFGPFRFDAFDRMLWRGDDPVPLTPKAIETLQVLLESGGRLVTKEDLMAKLWPNTFVEEANLSHQIYKVREALGEQADGTKYIETLSRRGYRFVAAVERTAVAAGPAAGQEASAERGTPVPLPGIATIAAAHTAPAESPAPELHEAGRRQVFRRGAVLVGALLVTAVVATYLLAMTGAVKPAATRSERSIAVLPFLPLTPADHDEAIELGMANALITRLTNVPELIVRPTSAVVQYQKPERDPVAAGREQQVDVVVDGKIQRANDRVRVTVQLLQVTDGRPVWAETFDETSAGVFAIQDAISERVVKALQIQMTDPARVELTKRDTTNLAAYDAYLRGAYHNATFAAGGFEKAVEYMQQAVALDPNYARAWAGLAFAYSELGSMGMSTKEARDKAREYVKRALDIDPDVLEAHAALCNIHMYYDWNWAAAEEDVRTMVRLRPGATIGHQFYSWYLGLMGRFDEGVAEARKGQRLDPLSQSMGAVLLANLAWAGRIDEALAEGKRAMELYPHSDPLWMAWAWIPARDYDKVLDAVARSPAHELLKQAHLGYVYGATGRLADAQRVLAKLQEPSRTGFTPHYQIAQVYAGLGDKDKAMEWLNKAYADRSPWMSWIKVEPMLDPLRDDPRFTDLLRRVGFKS